MFSELLRLFESSKGLIQQAKDQALTMLEQGRDMFATVTHALFAEADPDMRERIRAMDRKLNREQQAIRRMVFEHLVVCRGEDVLESVILVTIAVDLERIGDYTKNLSELIDMMPGALTLGQFEERTNRLREDTLRLFDLTGAAYREDDRGKTREALALYDSISKTCDGTLKEIFSSCAEEPNVTKEVLAVILALRYLKRISAHLKNIATVVTNPVDRIGFRPEKE
jgi:phosphate uptake regulator